MLVIDLIEKAIAQNKHDHGELLLYNNDLAWSLCVSRGQILYAADKYHPLRRWDRVLKQNGSKWDWGVEHSRLMNQRFWECQLLDRGIQQENLSLLRAKLIVRSIVQECLFELGWATALESRWKSHQLAQFSSSGWTALSVWEIRTVSRRAASLQQQWQTANLQHLNPSLSPVLNQVTAPQTHAIPAPYLNGQFTLWDIAWRLEKSVFEVARDLLPWADQGILRFRPIADSLIPPDNQPITPRSLFAEKRSSISKGASPAIVPRSLPSLPMVENPEYQQPLIACIDDSPVLVHTLTKILKSAGYRTLSIQEPMRGFAQLIEHQPDLILLDLMLPNADGYSVCKFLRETPAFKETPIIILTGQNTIVDRVRAKAVGATEFLGKPPNPEGLLQMISKYVVTP